jgi:hypothetical protein
MNTFSQLISYIAPAAPATRRPAEGNEPFLRPEIGFTPAWYREALGIDFGERWHRDVAYRRETVQAMRADLRRRFPGTTIGGIDRPDHPLDLLTGAYGATVVAAIYGLPIVYAADNWPNVEHRYLSVEAIDQLEPPDLDHNPFFQELLQQVATIARCEGQVVGFLNWQGVLNNAQRLRGQELFLDLLDAPERCHRLFDCISTTMIEGLRRLRICQLKSGVNYQFATVSNCLVNLVSPRHYRDLLLPYDQRITAAFGSLGVHNCAWSATPYLDHYAAIANVGYLDMGLDSDLPRAKALFPHVRRAVMYTPMDLGNKASEEIGRDLERIARDYGPCDVVCADIEAGTPDHRVWEILSRCEELSQLQSIPPVGS